MQDRRTQLPRERIGGRVEDSIDLLIAQRGRLSERCLGPLLSFGAILRYAMTRGFNTSSHHWRKLVGVVDCGVRGSAVSSPWL
jgi:hypothetical protein